MGEALVQAGIIDDYQLRSALGHQRRWGGKLGKSLIDMGFMDEPTLIKFLSEKLEYPAIDLSRSRISAKAFEALPKNIAEKYVVAPVLIKNTPGKKTLVLAMSDPTDLRAIDEIEFVSNYRIEPVLAVEYAIKKVLLSYGKEQEKEDKQQEIFLEDSGSQRMVMIQGEMNIQSEVKNAQTTNFKDYAPEIRSIPVHPTVERRELDFQAPALASFETYSDEEEEVKHGDDEPLEMIAEEAVEAAEAEVVEDAEIIEDIEPIGVAEAQSVESQPEEPIAEGEPVADGDPYEYDVVVQSDEPVEDVPESQAEEPGEETGDHVSVVQSFEELEALTGSKTEPTPIAEEAVEEPETLDSAAIEEVAEEDHEGAEPFPAEAVEDYESGEAVTEAAVESVVEEPATVQETSEAASVAEDYVSGGEAIAGAEQVVGEVEPVADEAVVEEPAEAVYQAQDIAAYETGEAVAVAEEYRAVEGEVVEEEAVAEAAPAYEEASEIAEPAEDAEEVYSAGEPEAEQVHDGEIIQEAVEAAEPVEAAVEIPPDESVGEAESVGYATEVISEPAYAESAPTDTEASEGARLFAETEAASEAEAEAKTRAYSLAEAWTDEETIEADSSTIQQGYSAEIQEEYTQAEEQAAEAAEPVDEPETAPSEEVATVAALNYLRAEIAQLAGKIEGLVGLFILKEEGRLSMEEFLDDLKKL